MTAFSAPNIPQELRRRRQWIVWRYVQAEGEPKPRKVPFYVSGSPRNGQQGTPEDVASLATFDEAVAACQRRGYSGLGLAMLGGQGLVALDFDACVVNGQITDRRVADLIDGTYAEFSPSGTGLRAFFLGDLRSRKDNANKRKRVGGVAGAPRLDGLFDIEVFGDSGFVTVTGHATPECELWDLTDTVAPLTRAVRDMYLSRWGDLSPGQLAVAASPADPMADLFGDAPSDAPWSASGAGSSGGAGSLGGAVVGYSESEADLFAMPPEKLGWSLDDARRLLDQCSSDVSRDEWLNAMMALHYEFDGSQDALDLADEWSSKASNYGGRRDVEGRWRSFGKSRGGAPITGRWLLAWHRDQVAVGGDERLQVALDELRLIVDECSGTVDLKTKVMPRIALLVAEFPVIDLEAYALVSARMKELKAPINKTEFKRLLRQDMPTSRTGKALHDLTEFGNTRRLLDAFGENLMYVPDAEQWFVWTGIYWRKALGNRTEIEHLCATVIAKLHEESHLHSNPEAFHAFCAASQKLKMVKAMVGLAEIDDVVCVPSAELDRHMHLLGVKNGVVDLRTGQLIEPLREHRITQNTHCDYDPAAKCPLYEKALRDTFYDDEEMIDYVLRALGYALQGDPVESTMFVAFGHGANGKGTIIDTARKAFGGYARVASPETFLADGKPGSSSGSGPREDLVRLRGARLVYVNEPDSNGELKEGLVKTMTGGDTIQARGVHAKHSVEIVPTWTIVMPTNYKPIIKGDDNGIWRRIRLIEFSRNFKADPLIQEDKSLKNRIAATELPGVLALIVRAGMRYQRTGLVAPAAVDQLTNSYRREQDYLGDWIEECCEVGEGLESKTAELWECWKNYSALHGMTHWISSSKSLGRRLDQKFPAKKGTGGTRMRVGIKPKEAASLF